MDEMNIVAFITITSEELRVAERTARRCLTIAAAVEDTYESYCRNLDTTFRELAEDEMIQSDPALKRMNELVKQAAEPLRDEIWNRLHS
jgi:hypothetical protein